MRRPPTSSSTSRNSQETPRNDSTANTRCSNNNPYRYKKLTGHELTLFRIRLSDNNKELRAIYTVRGKTVTMICIIERANDYKDLQRYLDKIND